MECDDDVCPKCDGETTFGFGLAGGVAEDDNPRGYTLCLECDWQDPKPTHTVCFPHGVVDIKQ